MPQYFTKETDEYIKLFLKTESKEEKHELFNEGIRPAFEKLIDGLMYSYNFFNIDDADTLRQDCLSTLYELLPKFDPDKGSKGFSYFNVVAKNWFMQKSRERSKKSKKERELHVDVDKKSIRTNPALTYGHHENRVLEREFWLSLHRELDFWRSKLAKKNETLVLEAVIYLLQNPELAPIYNKKAVYQYLRDMTGLNEKQVATVLKKMRDLYAKWKSKYHNDEEGLLNR